MSANRRKIGSAPVFIKADPISRHFPAGWKDPYFGRMAVPGENGAAQYTCPVCGFRFDHRDIDYLQGDHVWPWSLFGETSRDNDQLLCGECNAKKSNRLDSEIRRALGAGEFRRIVCRFLREQVAAGKLREDEAVREIIAASETAWP